MEMPTNPSRSARRARTTRVRGGARTRRWRTARTAPGPTSRLTRSEVSNHEKADLRDEREPGRLHRRTRRRHRLERAVRRALPVVVRPGGGDRRGAVRAQALGDDELALADRRPAAGCD